jgi:hypothetical protein
MNPKSRAAPPCVLAIRSDYFGKAVPCRPKSPQKAYGLFPVLVNFDFFQCYCGCSMIHASRSASVTPSLKQMVFNSINNAARWRCPPGVALLPVTDLNVEFPFSLMWRKDNSSPLLAKFAADVKSMVQQRGRMA